MGESHVAATKRSRIQRENDLRRISELYLQGLDQAAIAGQLGVSRQQISYDLKTLRQRWQESALANFNEKKAAELAKIDQLERTYWHAWEDSKKIHETTTSTTEKTTGADSEARPGPSPLRMKAAMRKEERDGDPEFLKGIQWCINKRCSILGLDAPKKGVLSGPDGQPLFKAYLGFDPEKDV
jgi:hypothetical protein